MFEEARSRAQRWLLAAALIPLGVHAQRPDTVRTLVLRPIDVLSLHRTGMRPAADTSGALILAGKRTEVITPGALDADLALNHGRQVFAKVPGIMVWENDGSGVQLGIAARGLSPNRSWEFNMRQDGHDISADAFGYPEAYYTPPMEAVERIEVVRGAASLAFGPQFGGLVNFVMKRGAPDRPLAGELRQTLGSYGLTDTYAALGGSKGRWEHYTFVHHRQAEGWRAHSRYRTTAAHTAVRFAVSPRLRIGFAYTRSDVVQQQPGGLTDAQLRIDPRRSDRARNWMLLPWNVAALTAEWRPDARTVMDVKLFGTLAERNSVGFIRGINSPDTVDRATRTYAPRQVDRDRYANGGLEVRLRRGFSFLRRQAQLSAGLRLHSAENQRSQLGTGTSGTDADLTVSGDYGRALTLTTGNAAAHAEVLLPVAERVSVVPGLRVEHIDSRVDGRISATGDVDSGHRSRQVLLLGLGLQVRTSTSTQAYANFSQGYRPVLYGDLTPAATTDVIDPDLRDTRGYNADVGLRGTIGAAFTFDIGGFLLHIDDRVGTVVRDGVNVRTNLGASLSQGVEAYAEVDLVGLFRGGDHPARTSFALALAYGYVDARYVRWDDPAMDADAALDVRGHQVEYAPRHIFRPGLTFRHRAFSLAAKASVVDAVYTNATNTDAPNAAATAGRIPGYTVVDASASWTTSPQITLSAGINNLMDTVYATRRAGGYPGPGLLPGMGRAFYVTLAARL
ncbi:MAG: TonB-dependent receptor [Flavobacteriales bacterium]|nr:TonB-dependent receptor [Flavobacteriales bacterium]